MGFLAQKEEKAAVLGNSYDDVGKAKRREDWSDVLREVDEMWFHLLAGGESLLMILMETNRRTVSKKLAIAEIRHSIFKDFGTLISATPIDADRIRSR